MPFAADLLLAALAAALLWAAVGDVRTFNIPNELNAGIALAAPLFWWASGVDIWPDAAARFGIGLAVFIALAAAFYAGMMGGGDVKMAAATALWLAPLEVVDFLMVMALAGGAVTLVALLRHRLRRLPGAESARPEVPYGVAIAVAGMWVIGARYLNQFG